MNDGAVGVVFVYLETPMHPGTGGGRGAIDLEIQRVRATQFPVIRSGAIKHVMRGLEVDPPVRNFLFGAEGNDGGGGAASPSSAQLLLFPVRSVAGLFGWITCPLALEELHRYLSRQAKAPKISQVIERLREVPIAAGQALIGTNCALEIDITTHELILEEYALMGIPTTQVDELAEWFSKYAIPASSQYWRQRLWKASHSRLVVLCDEDFADFTRSSTEVIERIKMDPERRRPAKGALWSEELLPQESVLFVGVSPLVHEGSLPQGLQGEPGDGVAAKIVGRVLRLTSASPLVQIGADASLGHGFCRLVGLPMQ